MNSKTMLKLCDLQSQRIHLMDELKLKRRQRFETAGRVMADYQRAGIDQEIGSLTAKLMEVEDQMRKLRGA